MAGGVAPRRAVLEQTDTTFHYVRRTIVDLLDPAPEVAAELNEIKPKDVQSMRKVARGQLIGTVEDPAMEGELYPRLEWSSGIESIVRQGSTFQMKQKDRMTVRTHPDVGFRLDDWRCTDASRTGRPRSS